MYIYIYIYINHTRCFESHSSGGDLPCVLAQIGLAEASLCNAANLRAEILDFRGFDSSRVLISRGGIPRPMGIFPEMWSQAIW